MSDCERICCGFSSLILIRKEKSIKKICSQCTVADNVWRQILAKSTTKFEQFCVGLSSYSFLWIFYGRKSTHELNLNIHGLLISYCTILYGQHKQKFWSRFVYGATFGSLTSQLGHMDVTEGCHHSGPTSMFQNREALSNSLHYRIRRHVMLNSCRGMPRWGCPRWYQLSATFPWTNLPYCETW